MDSDHVSLPTDHSDGIALLRSALQRDVDGASAEIVAPAPPQHNHIATEQRRDWNSVYGALTPLQDEESFIAEALYHYARLGAVNASSAKLAREAMRHLLGRCSSYAKLKLAHTPRVLNDVMEMLDEVSERATFEGAPSPPYNIRYRDNRGQTVSTVHLVKAVRRGNVNDFITVERYANLRAVKDYLRVLFPDHAYANQELWYLQNVFQLPGRWFSKNDFTPERLKAFVESAGFQTYREILEAAIRRGSGLKYRTADTDMTVLRLPTAYDTGPDCVYHLLRDVADSAFGCWRVHRRHKTGALQCCRLEAMSLLPVDVAKRGVHVRCQNPLSPKTETVGQHRVAGHCKSSCDQYFGMRFEEYISPTDLYTCVDELTYGTVLSFLFAVDSELESQIKGLGLNRSRYKGLYPDLDVVTTDWRDGDVVVAGNTDTGSGDRSREQDRIDSLAVPPPDVDTSQPSNAELDGGAGVKPAAGSSIFLYILVFAFFSVLAFLVLGMYNVHKTRTRRPHEMVELSPFLSGTRFGGS